MPHIDSFYPGAYLKASDFAAGPVLMTIAGIRMENVGQGDQAERKPVLHFHESNQGMVLNKTNGSAIAAVYGTETDQWIGKVLELRSELVDFAGKKVQGLRVGIPQQQVGGMQQFQQPMQGQPQQPMQQNTWQQPPAQPQQPMGQQGMPQQGFQQPQQGMQPQQGGFQQQPVPPNPRGGPQPGQQQQPQQGVQPAGNPLPWT